MPHLQEHGCEPRQPRSPRQPQQPHPTRRPPLAPSACRRPSAKPRRIRVDVRSLLRLLLPPPGAASPPPGSAGSAGKDGANENEFEDQAEIKSAEDSPPISLSVNMQEKTNGTQITQNFRHMKTNRIRRCEKSDKPIDERLEER